ncbi:MAG TPA: oligosaccharide flippase family protein [Patescibacteria group bacterium]|nr:oligosaccharide flippase family protein [Patescibacteria group bacterium]
MLKSYGSTSVNTLLRLVQQSPFLKYNAVFFFGNLGVAVLNYLFYPVLGRLMTPSDFGEVQALFALYMQATILLNILSLITIHTTVEVPEIDKSNQILAGLERFALIVTVSFVGLGLLFVGQLRDFLHFSDVKPFVALLLAVLISVPLVFRMAFLRGRKMFARSVIIDGAGSAAKLVIGPVLVIMGYKTFGAVAGLAISQVISLGIGIWWASQAGLKGSALNKSVELKQIYPQLRYGLAIFVASSVITGLLSMDIIAAKHYFSPYDAGLYAGISTVARIVYFLVAPLTGVLITMVSARQSMAKNRLRLSGSLVLIGSIGGFALIVLTIFPRLIIKLLVGSKYLAYADYLPRLGLVMLVLSFTNALLLYGIALKRFYLNRSAVIALLGTILLLYINHSHVKDVINNLLIGTSWLAIVLAWQIFIKPTNSMEEKNG